nr:histidine phosphatase family protein [Ramlibacter cellulosilyticus]
MRHANHDWVGRGIAGRQPDVSLNEEGRRQSQELVRRLQGVPFDAIVCSPQPRTQQTAEPLAEALGMEIQVHAGFDEVDMGEWVGMSFRELDALGEPWRHWCERRASAHPPGGEAFTEVPKRAMAALRELRERYPEGKVLVVSHGDVIKSIVATCLRMSLDDLETFDIAPASATVIAMGEDWAQLRLLNGTGPS